MTKAPPSCRSHCRRLSSSACVRVWSVCVNTLLCVCVRQTEGTSKFICRLRKWDFRIGVCRTVIAQGLRSPRICGRKGPGMLTYKYVDNYMLEHNVVDLGICHSMHMDAIDHHFKCRTFPGQSWSFHWWSQPITKNVWHNQNSSDAPWHLHAPSCEGKLPS